MIYVYNCINTECKQCNTKVEVNKPMSQSGEDEYCANCSEKLIRQYIVGGIVTGDGCK